MFYCSRIIILDINVILFDDGKKKFWNDSKDEKKVQFLGFQKNSCRCLKINIFKKRKRKKRDICCIVFI